MIDVLRSLHLPRAQDAKHGDIQNLLERLVIEVVSANYRYFLHERLMWAQAEAMPERYCWPPLLANERQVSGLFAHALSSVCPVSRPELGITRAEKKDREDAQAGTRDPNGRIDYYAAYGRRAVAVELKRCTLATSSKSERKVVHAHWRGVGGQAQSALDHMRRSPADYPHAAGVGLLVLRLFKTLSPRADPDEIMRQSSARVDVIAEDMRKMLRPDFLSVYRPPVEMQIIAGWKTSSGLKIFPGVIFAATVRVKAS